MHPVQRAGHWSFDGFQGSIKECGSLFKWVQQSGGKGSGGRGSVEYTTASWRSTTYAEDGIRSVNRGSVTFRSGSSGYADISVFQSHPKQVVDGFGGAFNENGWHALTSIDEAQREAVLKALFDPEEGCKFIFGRVPIGMSDFTIEKVYSLNETPGDYEMANFSIERDKSYNIPYVKAAMKYQPNLLVHASPWTPPTWMKTYPTYEGKYRVNGVDQPVKLKMDPQTLKAYALYFRKFVEEWGKEGIEIFAVFPQNEPRYYEFKHPSCNITGSELNIFIRDYLYPEFSGNGITTEIWYGTLNYSDDFANDIKPVLDDPVTRNVVKGYGFQWFGDGIMKQAKEYLNERDPFLRFKLMQTENKCYAGKNSWEDAVDTFRTIRSYFEAGANSYMYWNMVLDTNFNLVSWMPRAQNSMISIDTTRKQVIYNLEFYVMKHFSYYVRKGASYIPASVAYSGSKLIAAAFRNPDGTIVLNICNTSESQETVSVKCGDSYAMLNIPGRSFNTLYIGGEDSSGNWH